jgi:hypothetical protein
VEVVSKCYDKIQIVNSLVRLEHFVHDLKKDKAYRQKVLMYINENGNKTDAEIIAALTNKLTSTGNIETFSNDLQAIEFSRFVGQVFEKMELCATVEYDKITFIPADSVSSIEIVNYETRYAIQLYRSPISPDFVMIPKTYTILGKDVLK